MRLSTGNRIRSGKFLRQNLSALNGPAGLLEALCQRVVLNGSFVTDEAEPDDVDCVAAGRPDSPRGAEADAESRAGLPFLEDRRGDQDNFDFLVERFFATDREHVPKGMIEVIL